MVAARLRSASPGLIRVGLRLLAEGAWLSVVYAAVAVVGDRRVPGLGPLEMAVIVGLGAFIATRTHQLPGVGAVLLVGAVAVTGVGGWLLAGQALSGIIAAVALVRGAMIAPDWDATQRLETTLFRALPLVGLLWAATLVASPPELDGPFSASALWSTVLLISAGTIGIGWARLERLQRSVTDRPTRRAWRLLVIVIGLVVVPLAVPFALASGIPLASLGSPIVGLLQLAIGLLLLPFYVIAGVLLNVLAMIFQPGQPLADVQLPPQLAPAANPDQVAQQYSLLGVAVTIVTFGAVALVLVIGVLLVARWLVGRESRPFAARPEATPDIERSIVRPMPAHPRSRAGERRRRNFGHPREAVGAYLAALGELEPLPALARQPAETPARHASRLRATAEPVALDVSHLAADYQLARYAARPLTSRENRRAVSRFERLRATLRAPQRRK